LIYQQNAPLDRLEQGDILKKTDELQSLLAKYHPYYAEHKDNKFFVVLTQSCDLVLRGESCKAHYISLAPVRPLKVILKRHFEGKLDNVGVGAQPFATHKVRTSLEQFLQRLFNNNEPSFFYYENAHQSGIYEEMCAMLALPISLKSEHYQTLRAAKLAGITDVFQAKLGWLVGQMYSRVGTPDIQPETLSQKVKTYTEGVAIWLEEGNAKSLRVLVEEYKTQTAGGVVGRNDLATMISMIPKRKNLAIDAVLGVVASQGLIGETSSQRTKLRRALENNSDFSKLFSNA
jgi:hypothetical protein